MMRKNKKIHKNNKQMKNKNLVKYLQDSGIFNENYQYYGKFNNIKEQHVDNKNYIEMYFEILGFERDSALQIISNYANDCNITLYPSNSNLNNNQENGIIAKGYKQSIDKFFNILESFFTNKLLKGNIVEFTLQKLKQQNLTLCIAESCTGGVLSSMITSINGASLVYKGGITTYSIESKQNILGIKDSILQTYGVYSEECVRAMARGAIDLFQADIAIATSGLATKDLSKNNFLNLPAGIVFTCVLMRDKLPFTISQNYLDISNKICNKDSRIFIQQKASIQSLKLLLSIL